MEGIPKDMIYPTIVRGCMFDAGWEFDAPCVIYYPWLQFGFGGNTGHLHDMVENICIDLSIAAERASEASKFAPKYGDMLTELARECEWRGWSINGFSKRKNAWHVEFTVTWNKDYTKFEITNREQWGPFGKAG